jgi:hypothetical protein
MNLKITQWEEIQSNLDENENDLWILIENKLDEIPMDFVLNDKLIFIQLTESQESTVNDIIQSIMEAQHMNTIPDRIKQTQSRISILKEKLVDAVHQQLTVSDPEMDYILKSLRRENELLRSLNNDLDKHLRNFRKWT